MARITIGRVLDSGTDSVSAILYDESSNPVGIILDGAIYRIQAQSKLVGGSGNVEMAVADATTLPANTPGIVVAGLDGTTSRFLRVNSSGQPVIVGAGTAGAPSGGVVSVQGVTGGQAIPVSQSATTATDLLVGSAKNSGSADLLVDGSLAPVDFTVNADPTNDIYLSSIRMTLIVSTSAGFNGATFGSSTSLTNGVLVEVTVNNGTVITLTTLSRNEDFLDFVNVGDALLSFSGAADIISSRFTFGETVRLVAGTSDKVLVRVRDNLTAPALQLSFFRATIYGVTQ